MEKVPDDVIRELEELRRTAMTAPCEEVVLLRDCFNRMVKEFGDAVKLLEAVALIAPEVHEKYHRALIEAARRMGEQLDVDRVEEDMA